MSKQVDISVYAPNHDIDSTARLTSCISLVFFSKLARPLFTPAAKLKPRLLLSCEQIFFSCYFVTFPYNGAFSPHFSLISFDSRIRHHIMQTAKKHRRVLSSCCPCRPSHPFGFYYGMILCLFFDLLRFSS